MTHEMTAFEAGYQAYWDGVDRVLATWTVANDKVTADPKYGYDAQFYNVFYQKMREAAAGWLEAEKNCALTEWST